MKLLFHRVTVVIVTLAVLVSAAPAAYNAPPSPGGERQGNQLPGILTEIGVDQRLDNQVPMDVEFTDEHGNKVTLADYSKPGRPIVLNLVYYGCPMLCGQVLNGLTRSLKMLKDVPMVPGKDFEVVTLSFDSRETASLAMEKKLNYIKEYDQPGASEHWHWLTGNKQNIQKITDAVGFRFAWDEKQQQFAHASAIFLLTPEGKVSRYFFGIEYSPKDMRLGLTEASGGNIGGPVEKIMLLCYHYDATLGKYSVLVLRLIQIGGILTLVALGSFMFFMFRRDYKASPKAKNP